MTMWIKKNDIENLKRVVQVIGLVGSAIDAAAPYVKEYVPKAAGVAVDGAKAVIYNTPRVAKYANVKRKDLISHVNKINSEKKEKRQLLKSEKSEKDLATTIIEEYGIDIKVSEFINEYEKNPDGFFTEGGCYAIFTLPALAKKISKFDEVYVGMSPSMGEDIYKQLMGLGNVDVYSDMKTKKNMRIVTYPCLEENAVDLYQSLIQGFGAYDSYNRWELPIETTETE